MKFIENKGLGFFKSELLEAANIPHGLTSKKMPPDITPFTKNPSEVDSTTLDPLLDNLGMHGYSVVLQKQVHSDSITIIDEHNLDGKITVLDSNDGLITNLPGVCLVSLSADCMSLIIAHPESGAIGNAHCGRMGALRNLPMKLVLSMCREYIVMPSEIIAVMGTCISVTCYEVGDDVVDEIKRIDPTAFGFLITRNSRRFFDLRSYVYSQLIASGIPPENIDSQPICSHCDDELFYSYRRDGSVMGRMAALIGSPARK